MNFPENLKYTKTDEWFDPDTGKMGLTDYAQSHLSDIVYFESNVEISEKVNAEQEVGSVDSVKANSSIYSPIDGEIIEINEKLKKDQKPINIDPYGEGWMLVIQGNEFSNLMDADAYEKYCEEREQ